MCSTTLDHGACAVEGPPAIVVFQLWAQQDGQMGRDTFHAPRCLGPAGTRRTGAASIVQGRRGCSSAPSGQRHSLSRLHIRLKHGQHCNPWLGRSGCEQVRIWCVSDDGGSIPRHFMHVLSQHTYLKRFTHMVVQAALNML
jgi:hypothetical protein